MSVSMCHCVWSAWCLHTSERSSSCSNRSIPSFLASLLLYPHSSGTGTAISEAVDWVGVFTDSKCCGLMGQNCWCGQEFIETLSSPASSWVSRALGGSVYNSQLPCLPGLFVRRVARARKQLGVKTLQLLGIHPRPSSWSLLTSKRTNVLVTCGDS